LDLTNASAIVTGGVGGLRRRTVRRLAQQGAKVVIADVSNERGEALAREVGAAPSIRADRLHRRRRHRVLVDSPEHLFPHATVWWTAEEPRIAIDARVEIGYRNTGEEVIALNRCAQRGPGNACG
jgi:NAD(P)-dependent dehydrogenase (short-subunit alcohol dehydrogenase family)